MDPLVLLLGLGQVGLLARISHQLGAMGERVDQNEEAVDDHAEVLEELEERVEEVVPNPTAADGGGRGGTP